MARDRIGVPMPAFSTALAFYDGYRTERLPANLLQAQRDFFGAHTYERVDKPRGEFFHTNWTGPRRPGLLVHLQRLNRVEHERRGMAASPGRTRSLAMRSSGRGRHGRLEASRRVGITV